MASSRYPIRDHFLIRDRTNSFYDGLTGEHYDMPEECCDALFALDGETPVSVAMKKFPKEERRALLEYFDDSEFLDDGKKYRRISLSFFWILFKDLDSVPFRRSGTSMFVTFLLEWISIPLLIAYIAFLTFSDSSTNYYFGSSGTSLFVLSIVLGLAFCVGLHEFAHSIAGQAYGARTLEAGVFFSFAPGGYVLLDETVLKKQPINSVQVYGAGCECNALLATFLLYCGSLVNDELSPVFNLPALTSLLLMNNLVPVFKFLDGGKAMRLLFKESKNTRIVYGASALVSLPIFIWMIPKFLEEYWDITGWSNILASVTSILALIAGVSFHVTLAYVRIQQYKEQNQEE